MIKILYHRYITSNEYGSQLLANASSQYEDIVPKAKSIQNTVGSNFGKRTQPKKMATNFLNQNYQKFLRF